MTQSFEPLEEETNSLTEEQIEFLRGLAPERDDSADPQTFQLKNLENFLPLVLGSYTATLKPSDRLCLEILRLIEQKSGADFAKYAPIAWGVYGRQCYDNLKKFGSALYNRPSLDDLLKNCVDSDLMLKSSLNLPLQLKIDNEKSFFDTIDDSSYDPRFILPLFNGFFRSDTVVNCKFFIKTNCLRYTLACLSLSDKNLRKCAYAVLFKLRKYLTSTGVKFEEKSNILNLLTTLKNSLEKKNARLPSISTCFLGKAAWILVHPGDKMFNAVNSYVLLKPQLDMKNVAEFYKFFHSCSAEHFSHERQWILRLMDEGLREYVDFKIFQRRFAFKLLLSFFGCRSMCSVQCKGQILRILQRACRIKKALNELTFDYHLLAWILSSVQDLAQNRPVFSDFARILIDAREGLREIGEKAWNSAKIGWISCAYVLVKNWTEKSGDGDDEKKLAWLTKIERILKDEQSNLTENSMDFLPAVSS